jgi:hypothetical protein
MKTLILIFSMLITGTVSTFAQCDKKIIIHSSKTDHLDASGAVTRTVDETAVVEITKTTINITVNDERKMTGAIKANVCSWTVPFKNGKTVLKATMSNNEGGDKEVTMTITGSNGKVDLMFEVEGEPGDRIRITPDKFEAGA